MTNERCLCDLRLLEFGYLAAECPVHGRGTPFDDGRFPSPRYKAANPLYQAPSVESSKAEWEASRDE